jgi:protein-histidine N-methyltransferase
MRVSVVLVALVAVLAGAAGSEVSTAEIEEFLNWLRNTAKAELNNVTLAENPWPLGLGIQATGAVKEGAPILGVPLNAVLCRDTILAHPSMTAVRSTLALDSDDETLITVFLIVHRALGESSPFAPYLKVLPKSVPSLLTWSADELSLIKPAAPMLSSTASQRQATASALGTTGTVAKAVKDALSAIARGDLRASSSPLDGDAKAMSVAAQALDPSAAVTPELVVWAQSLVESRALTLRGRKFLVPFADMANHRRHPQPRSQSDGEHFASHHLLKAGRFVVKADRPAQSGEPVEEDYGDSPNELYIAHHGMVVADNPFDCATVLLPRLRGSSGSNRFRLELLHAMGVANPPSLCVKPSAPREALLRPESVAFLRVRALPEDLLHSSSPCGEIMSGHSGPSMDQIRACLGPLSPATDTDLKILLKASKSHEALVGRVLRKVETLADQPGNLQLRTEHTQVAKSFLSSQVSLLSALNSRLKGVIGRQSEPRSSRKTRAPVADSSLQERVDLFNQWFSKLSPAPKPMMVTAAAVPGGMRIGVLTTSDVPKEQVYLGVPPTAIMDERTANDCPVLGPVFQALRKRFPRGDSFHELLFHLVREAVVLKEQSFWWPYLQLLPSPDETAFPVFWSRQDLELLQGSPVLATIQEYQRDVQGKFDAVNKAVLQPQVWKDAVPTKEDPFPPEAFTFETYQWAHAMLDSRSIWWDGARHLVPMLDLINCREGADPARVHSTRLDSHGMAVTRADMDYPKGSQLWENYGQPNYVYFMYHGFSLVGRNPRAGPDEEANTHDCARLDYALPIPEDPALSQKLSAALAAQGLRFRPGTVADLCINVRRGTVDRDGSGTRTALATVAAVNATLDQGVGASTVEGRAWEVLRSLALDTLRAMARVSTTAQDELILSLESTPIDQLTSVHPQVRSVLEDLASVGTVSRQRRLEAVRFRHSQKLLLKAIVSSSWPAASSSTSASGSASAVMVDEAERLARLEEL